MRTKKKKKIEIRHIRKNNHAKQYKDPIQAQWILTDIKLKKFKIYNEIKMRHI